MIVVMTECCWAVLKRCIPPILASVCHNLHKWHVIALSLSTPLLRVVRSRGIRCWVDGQILSQDRKVIHAECSAQLVNVRNWF